MVLETYNAPWDFELLDTGNGYRLERWGDAAPRTGGTTGTGVVLVRPDPQIIWPRSLPDNEWDKAFAVYKTGSDDTKGKWEIKKPLPEPWVIEFPMNPHPNPLPKGEGENVKFLLKLSPFKHTGLFAEQAAQWSWMQSRIKDKGLRILNLFAYTGGATMVLAKMGCQVTHVDASKPAITWANQNHKLNNLPADSVRWMLDDAVKFVKRELKRGAKYGGIIMDPPAFGHSPTGKTWKFNDGLPGLLADCIKLLSDDAKFLVINGYATNSSAIAIHNLLEDAMKSKPGKIEFGELCLSQKNSRLISTGIFARWWS